ncbi:MAG: hypothetical protein AXA67_00565 [Methylothermaceae bacteria B42]|nr:MAG: hypothetical protein AXA67_00565 [Methylothermaceae bacteria B42]HHJ38792.1 tRNA (cytidine(34)-2'-O)-methyltransferase [Methylothermaceae bacterium]
MFEVALFEPEIAPNTGNIMRLCANTGCRLHLIEPLGFDLDEKKLRRAGLDYRDMTVIHCHRDFQDFLESINNRRLFAFTTKATQYYCDAQFLPGDVLLFGPETRGLPANILDRLPPEHKLRLPMVEGSRSLNLANTVAVSVYEAWRQQRFIHGQ